MKFDTDRTPFFFLLMTVLLLPLAHGKTVFFGVPLYYPEWAVFLALGAFEYRAWRSGSPRFLRLFTLDRWVLLGGALFLTGALLSFLLNPFSLTGLGMFKSWFFFPFLFGLLLREELRMGQRPLRLLAFWFGILVLVALRSLVLFFLGDQTYDGRLAGDYASPNFLAYFLAPAPLIGYYLLLVKEKMGGQNFWKTIFIGSGVTATLAVLFLTRSYGVWMALLAAGTVFFAGTHIWKRAGIWRALVVFLPVLVVGGFFLADQGSEKWRALIEYDSRSSLASRLMIWQSAGLLILDNPVVGIGVGRFQEKYLEYQRFFPPYLEWAVPEPHNFFLALFLTTGLLGVFGFCLLLGRLGILLYRSFRSSKEKDTHVLLIALWILFLVYGLFDTPYFKTDLAYSFFLVWSLSLAVGEKKTPSLR